MREKFEDFEIGETLGVGTVGTIYRVTHRRSRKTYALKLLFTSFLTVVTLTVTLIPLAVDVGMSPWIIAMIILMASEVWFFPFQVDWHTLAYSTTEAKGFTYPLMCRVNPFYAVAFIVALIASIPYWRYLGLMG